ncbi:hypothetical protein, partial [Nonomuraea turkmeniaca]|uniref:hypothetical protein n=1 Tax=Nonomuraea turkmeniaca TaxID=103838 RepID=UPI001B87910A
MRSTALFTPLSTRSSRASCSDFSRYFGTERSRPASSLPLNRPIGNGGGPAPSAATLRPQTGTAAAPPGCQLSLFLYDGEYTHSTTVTNVTLYVTGGWFYP